MRVVLDTNVLLSACLKPDGLEARLVDMALAGTIEACVTDEVWAEYRDVLYREKFASCRARADFLLHGLSARAVRVTAGEKLAVASDEDDNRFLECAAAAAAPYLVSGNQRHFPAEYCCTRVVNARLFFMMENIGT